MLVTILGRKENITIDILIQANKVTSGFHFFGHPSATLLGSGYQVISMCSVNVDSF